MMKDMSERRSKPGIKQKASKCRSELFLHQEVEPSVVRGSAWSRYESYER